MAAITGVIYPDIFQMKDILESMMHALSHRGADSWDTCVYKNIKLGCRGTTIENDEKNNISAIIDGHIYNHKELKAELKNAGCPLSQVSDARLVVEAYKIWGEDFPTKIEGNFAIVVLDRSEESLTLVRDRIGKKPMYWYFDQDQFIFASELKALLASGFVPQTPALDTFAAYLTLGYFPQDMTPISRVNKLLPAHYLHYSFTQGITIRSYWSYSSCFTKSLNSSPKVIIQELDEMLWEATKQRLDESKNVGCFVSGGLGSASTAYYVKNIVPEKDIHAFTAGFQGQNDEDVEAAEICAQTLGIPHVKRWITPQNFLDEFVMIAWHLDEPLADHTVVSTWELAKIAAPYTKNVFSGMGSDEFVAGHSRYSIAERSLAFSTQLKHYIHPFLRNFFFPFLNFFSKSSVYHLLKEVRSNPWQSEYLEDNVLFHRDELSKAFPTLKGLFDTDIMLRKFNNISRIQSMLSTLMYIDVKTRLPECYILQYDRLTAAHGLDWNAPFFDRKIIEYLAAIPEPLYLREFETASYLKAIAEKIYPPEIVNKPKKTRRNFLRPWLDISELKTAFHMLLQGTLVETGLISQNWLREKTASPKTMHESFDLLWAVLALEVWFRLFINFPVTGQAPSVPLIEFLSET